MTYSDKCAYTIRHSTKLKKFSRSDRHPPIDTKKKAWVTVARLVEKERRDGRIVPVLFACAEDTADIVAAADLLWVKTGSNNSFKFTNFRYLDRPIPKATLKLTNGRKLSRGFIRDYAICMTPPGLASQASRPPRAYGSSMGGQRTSAK